MNILKFSKQRVRSSLSLIFSLIATVAPAVFSPADIFSQTAFFMRYEHRNPDELRRTIDESCKILSEARRAHNQELIFQTSIDLGELLTVARRESEAIAVLEPLLKFDLDRAAPEDRAWLYLNYATANQYFQRRAAAGSYYKKALKFVRKHKLETVEHFVLHHYGRFLVETGDFRRAERRFTEALKIRQKLNDARIDSTRKALAELRRLKAAAQN